MRVAVSCKRLDKHRIGNYRSVGTQQEPSRNRTHAAATTTTLLGGFRRSDRYSRVCRKLRASRLKILNDPLCA